MKKISLLALPLVLLGATFFLGGCGYQNPNQNKAPTTNPTPNPPATAPVSSPTEGSPAPEAGQTASAVTIQNFAFSPSSLTVKKGQTVTWTNQDSAPHQIASDSGAFQGPSLSKGQAYSFTFSDTGTFPYHCAIHPMMKGTIVVQ